MSGKNPPTESARATRLAEEIIEAQKVRSALLKWKLVLVSGLGAAGLGLTSADKGGFLLLLALIPLVAVYVDLLCSSLNLRIILIGRYFAEKTDDPYEAFVGPHRIVFSLEDWALYGSSYCLSGLLTVVGAFLFVHGLFAGPAMSSWPTGLALVLSGLVGAILTRWVETSYAILAELRKLDGDIDATSFFRSELGKQVVTFKFVSNRWHRFKALFQFKESVQNQKINHYLSPAYRLKDIEALRKFLDERGTFAFRRLPNGLFPAAAAAAEGDDSGYQHVWVRDNVHIAHAHYRWGDVDTAVRNASTLMAYFQRYRWRFDDIIKRPELAKDPMNRPHVRFDGQRLEEIDQPWAHAQNDALGYFVWFWCKLARAGKLICGSAELECLGAIVLYLRAIRYWEDADSGHWEEAPKVSASSIGTVLAGLVEFSALAMERSLWGSPMLSRRQVNGSLLSELVARGRRELGSILPHECRQGPPETHRRFDSALLFLIYPLQVVSEDQTREILVDVMHNLEGEYGIRRYLRDSYWCPNYKDKYPADQRSGDFSRSVAERDAHIHLGQEAQWCLFDPIISAIHGLRFKENDRDPDDFKTQVHYLNRALGQLTAGDGVIPELRCPEAYYLENDRYVPNDHTPLQWTQANLKLALHLMRESLR
ncbi:glycoside hydrolase family 15 protein [Trichloromonas sp.]|uniref:glycoside hydrolase family 15 protein n=1 Tax=Trichloromonas sp. TaxID=3069249 RepID=UPI003D81A956